MSRKPPASPAPEPPRPAGPELIWHPLGNVWIVRWSLGGESMETRFPATRIRARQEAEAFLAALDPARSIPA